MQLLEIRFKKTINVMQNMRSHKSGESKLIETSSNFYAYKMTTLIKYTVNKFMKIKKMKTSWNKKLQMIKFFHSMKNPNSQSNLIPIDKFSEFKEWKKWIKRCHQKIKNYPVESFWDRLQWFMNKRTIFKWIPSFIKFNPC